MPSLSGYDTNQESSQASIRKVTISRVGSKDVLDITEPGLTVAIQYSDGNAIYVGESSPGSVKGAEVWRIKKITYDGDGNATDVQWADGDTNFDNEWDEKAGYDYS